MREYATEIISVGTELLLGHVTNTDARDVSEMLSKIGINVLYHTVVGDWHYFTVDDGQIDLEKQDYLFISTLSGYEQLKKFYGEKVVLPLYIEVEDDQRLWRSVCRERRQAKPNYEEVCRRFLADQQDFSEEELMRAGIVRRYKNTDLEECVKEVAGDVTALKG